MKIDTDQYSKEMRRRVDQVLVEIEKEIRGKGTDTGNSSAAVSQGTSHLVKHLNPTLAELVGEQDDCTK